MPPINKIIYLACFVGFLLLPIAVLLLRAFRPKRMPWLLAFVIVAVLGWLLVNGAVYFKFEYLGDLMDSYKGKPPEDLVKLWSCDGAQRVFALLFGWIYALVWFAPSLLIYSLIQLARRWYTSRPGGHPNRPKQL